MAPPWYWEVNSILLRAGAETIYWRIFREILREQLERELSALVTPVFQAGMMLWFFTVNARPTIGLCAFEAKLRKSTSLSSLVSEGVAPIQLTIMWFKALLWTFNTLLKTLEYCLDIIHCLRCFTLPWLVRRVGESLEKILWQHNRGTVQESYKHQRLDCKKKQIRLLRIPRQHLFWGHLRCTLITVSMDELPPFKALSYRWGFAKMTDQTELIFIDEKPLSIPSSAYQLLHACSSVFTDKLVWIDAICINQTDVEEKSRQLPLMKDIYSKAKKVIIWPGDEWDSGMAMRILKRALLASLLYEPSEEMLGEFFEKEWDRRAWNVLVKLWENPYFTRMWVIQEVVLGCWNVEIYHGGFSLPWAVFIRANNVCLRPRPRVGPRSPLVPSPVRTPALMDTIACIGLMCMLQYAAMEKRLGYFHIGHLLAPTVKSRATDPRDKVFALSGLLTDHALPENLLDYTKSTEEVFTETARIVLEQERDPYALFAFAGIGWPSNLCNLPSWAVDWSRSEMPNAFSDVFYVDFPFVTGKGSQDQPHRAQRRPSIRIHPEDPRRVSVRGTVVDQVAKDVEAAGSSAMAQETGTIIQFAQDLAKWYLKAKDLVKTYQHTYPHMGQSLEEAFWRTVVADRAGDKRPAPAYFEACSKIFEKISHCGIKAYGAEVEDLFRFGVEVRDIWPTELETEAQFHEFLHAIGWATENRKFIVGDRGFLGLAPPLSKVSDLICLLDGAPTPVILRRQEEDSGSFAGCYYLVGECYVHGLKTGADAERDSSATFIIS
ncbi:Heterokaryon incompatibility protein (HET) domain containing protein [Naviculisporaceae sp. PSN 640]